MILFDKNTDSFRYAVWEVEEDVDSLLSILPDSDDIRMEADKRFRSETRKREWIAVRVLLYTLLQKKTRIAYTDNGAPLLPGEKLNISISHTCGNIEGRNVMYVAVALSATHKVGIDIERISVKVRKVRDRFIRNDEKADTLTSLLLQWSAKEAAFKILSAEGVDFIRHLRISPFTEADEGRFTITESKTEENHRMDVMYKIYHDFVLTFICTD